jgi:hypothetical protein
MTGEPRTSYRMRPHHSWLKRRVCQSKKELNLGVILATLIDMGGQDFTTS